MYKNKITKKVIDDYNFIINKLLQLKLYRDSNQMIAKDESSTCEQIIWSRKNGNNILYDVAVSSKNMLDTLLNDRQFSIVLYDKSIFQFQCIIENENIKKIIMLYLKKDNKIWSIEDINHFEAMDEPDYWFEQEYGCPIMIRIDYDPESFVEVEHSKAHMTISNAENCRIPMKTYFMFSEFVSFILWNFYSIKIEKSPVCYNADDTITTEELKIHHINWN